MKYRNGNIYLVHKMKVDGVWYDAVLYQNSAGETFSDDFRANFTEVTHAPT